MRYSSLVVAGTVLSFGGCSGCPPPAAPSMDWVLLDKNTGVNEAPPSGQIRPGDRYYVTLRVKDPAGIKRMSVWGDGSFHCETAQVPGGQFGGSPNPLPVKLPRQDNVLPSPDPSGWIQSAPFQYDQLSCGKYAFGPGPSQEYFVTSGTLHMHGEAENAKGTVTTASLDLHP